jgi:hypothetical protein
MIELRIEKDKKPRDLSWILKSSVLEAAINTAGIQAEFTAKYWLNGPLLECFYWSSNEKSSNGRFYIRTGVCEGYERKDQQHAMETDVIPNFIEWARELVELPDNATELLKEPYFSAYFENGKGVVRRGYNT